ncbi:DUF4136 domain-containing protein [Alteromonas sp. 1_MG-2023]|uniref:DUF4136 domain-containing protein n=1 Tax=Alteromonas sp. 1_MG-2023 TaxID=3062669 RepID=UPI0026E24ACB|nr:DUF4136 domain-containing protein [Alteromonas sp. 1_MG-2023]
MTFALLVLAFLAGCASKGPQINLDESQNFAEINTFFVRAPLNSVNPEIENQLTSAISRALIAKGLKPSSEEGADVLVGFLPSTASEENDTRLNLGLGTGVFGRSTGISLGSIFSVPIGERVTQYQNLQIDVVKGEKFIYSAVGSVEVESTDSVTIQNKLGELVANLLEAFPAK